MSFYGSTLRVSGVFPSLENVAFGPYEFAPAEGPDDFEFLHSGGIDEEWDVTSTRIVISITENNTASSAAVNAWLIEDIHDLIPDIQSVEIVSQGTTADFDASMIEWSQDSILIDYVREGRGISVRAGETLELAVTFDPQSGSNQDDTLSGTRRADGLEGKGGADVIRGKGGADVIRGGEGSDHLLGGGGRDRLLGGAGSDMLQGGRGRDKIQGGSGRDSLNGGTGNDSLTGGKGADTFVFAGRFGGDTVLDFAAHSNAERLDLSGIASIRGMKDLRKNHLSQDGDDVVITDSRGNSITLLDVDANDLGRGDFIF